MGYPSSLIRTLDVILGHPGHPAEWDSVPGRSGLYPQISPLATIINTTAAKQTAYRAVEYLVETYRHTARNNLPLRDLFELIEDLGSAVLPPASSLRRKGGPVPNSGFATGLAE